MNRAARSLVLCALYALLCCVTPVLAAGTLNETDAPVAKDPELNAYSAILLNMDTEEVLYEYNADETNYPASTTKMMTALLTLEHGNLKDTVTVSETAIDAVPLAASTWGLVPGEKLSVHQLLQVMLVVSASEATTVAAEYVAGDIDKFVDMMNEKAEELGCTGTHFANTHGCPDSDHYTTARDLSKIALAAMEYEEFRDIVSTAVTTIEPTNMSDSYVITSTNGILPGSQYPEYDYPYAIGIKTGHTSDAGFCLASAADKDGLRLLCVVMGTPSRASSFAQTIDLFEWGYDNYDIINYGKKPAESPKLPTEDSALEEVDEPDITKASLEASALEETSVQEVISAPSPTPEQVTPSPTPTVINKHPQHDLKYTITHMERPVLIFFLAIGLAIVALLVTLVVLLVRRKK